MTQPKHGVKNLLWIGGAASLISLAVACGGTNTSPTALGSLEELGASDSSTVTLYFDGDAQTFEINDLAVAVALFLNPDATIAEIQQTAQDIFDVTLTDADITGAGPNPLANFDLNGDGTPGTIEDLGVAIAALMNASDVAAAEAMCLDILGQSCNIAPGTLIPGPAATPFPPGLGLPLQSDPDVALSSSAPVFTVQVLHAADQEAGVDAIEFAPRFSAVLNGLRAQFNNTITVASGDLWIPGPFYNATGGVADININSALGFQAAALGNHEFDLGTNPLSGLIGRATFPYLSANLDFSPNSDLSGLVVDDGQPADTIPGQLAKSTTITVGGETFGVVGLTTPLLPNIASPGNVIVEPSNPSDLAALAAIAQQQVDSFTAQGINKIILLAHLQQIQNEITLAGLLQDVDIIVAGGSDTLLANPSNRILTQFGKSPSGLYPLLFNSATNEPVALVNTDREYRYVGRLIASFDEDGILARINPLSGAYAADEQGVAESGGSPIPEVVEAVASVQEVIAEKDGGDSIFGSTTVFLQGERQNVRTRETNLGNLTADANLFTARQTDSTVAVSIKNGGGIRASIGAVEPGPDGNLIPPVGNAFGKQDGDISALDIENSLRFNNTLTLLTVSREGLKAILEHGVANIGGGQTIQVGGVSFSFDPAGTAIAFNGDGSIATPGTRIRNVALIDADGNPIEAIVQNGVVVPGADIRLVTLNFLAAPSSQNPGLGGDRYPFPVFASDVVQLEEEGEGLSQVGGEQKALADFLAANSPFTQPDPVNPADRNRIQDISQRADTVLTGL
ncbi:MAG: bifunctional metallophosphatase/5'-nucleotidase [Synechococcaceae cyanobacterium SM2_3_2]|nr:bifunctional metallophosphatase/5'-nucleotidase [Synechococcaceae cyanobacterium SM2_3_2]